MERFRGGLIIKAHRLLYHSTLGSRVMKRKMLRVSGGAHLVLGRGGGTWLRVWGLGFEVQGLGFMVQG